MCNECSQGFRQLVVAARDDFFSWVADFMAEERMLRRFNFAVAYEDYQRRLRRARQK